MQKRFSRRLLLGYDVKKVESYIQEQAEQWRNECEQKDRRIRALEEEVKRLNAQIEAHREQDKLLMEALAHAERMSKGEPHPVLSDQPQKDMAPSSNAEEREGSVTVVEQTAQPTAKTEGELRLQAAIEENLKALNDLERTWEQKDKPHSDAAEPISPADMPVGVGRGLDAALPGAGLWEPSEDITPDWRGMLKREYEQKPTPTLSGEKHEKLEEIARELGIE